MNWAEALILLVFSFFFGKLGVLPGLCGGGSYTMSGSFEKMDGERRGKKISGEGKWHK